MITNFWAINQKPTGSKDPFAIRRAAIGIVRILLERRLDALIYRAKFVPTIFSARQFVNHGHILVNGKSVNIECDVALVSVGRKPFTKKLNIA